MIDFDCPRCASAVTETFYGPCKSCRNELRDKMWFDKEAFEAAKNAAKTAVQADSDRNISWMHKG